MSILDISYFVILAATLFVQLMTLSRHKKSLVGNLLIYSITGTIFLTVIRLFFFLTDAKVISLDEMTVMICWHLMFYLTIGTFIFATRSLLKIVNINSPQELTSPFPALFGVSVSFLIVLLFSKLIDVKVSPVFENSIFDRSGLMHFIAFAFAGFAAFDLGKVRKKFSGNIGVISTPMIISLVFLSIIHLWELLVESWKVIHLEGELGEIIEGYLWIPVLLFIFYAFFALKKKVELKLNYEQPFANPNQT